MPRVVGTIHSPGSLRRALRLAPEAVDLLELRVDHFVDDLVSLRRNVPRVRHPLILTVRHPAEGGAGRLAAARRLALYREFLPRATLVDIEIRSIVALEPLLREINEAGAGLIISDHHFRRTPGAAELQRRVTVARSAGADVIKIAARTTTAADAARLLALLPGRAGTLMSVMGMGPLGKASRLLYARAGSVLNYGYLDQPQVSGQWPAVLLRERLAEVLGES